MIGKALLFWVVLAVIGVLNGVLRQLGYGPYMSAAAAHVVSCFTALVLIFAAVRVYVGWERERLTPRRAAWVGALWVGLTILFEFGFGHWVVGHPWDRLVADYNVFAGRLWVLVLVGIGVAPWFWSRRLRAGRGGRRELPRRPLPERAERDPRHPAVGAEALPDPHPARGGRHGGEAGAPRA